MFISYCVDMMNNTEINVFCGEGNNWLLREGTMNAVLPFSTRNEESPGVETGLLIVWSLTPETTS